jgi:DNA-binding transcriptional LysR family regulator
MEGVVVRNLEEMAIFARVGDLGSISGAARALGLPKSSVSRAVARLETGFAARLVERSTRQVRLTEIGRALHAHCRAMVAEAENAAAEIAAYQGHPSGLLRIAAPATVGRNILGPQLPEFLSLYPEIDLQLQLTDRLLDPVADEFDVVIHIGWLSDSPLIARKITDIGAVLVASRAYIEAHGVPESIEALERHAVIGFPILGAPPLELVAGRERVKVPTWKRFACNDPIINLDLVRRGVAIAPLSAYFAGSGLASGDLVQILPGYQLHDPPALYALYTSRTALSPKIAVFLDYLSELAVRIRQDPGLIRA